MAQGMEGHPLPADDLEGMRPYLLTLVNHLRAREEEIIARGLLSECTSGPSSVWQWRKPGRGRSSMWHW